MAAYGGWRPGGGSTMVKSVRDDAIDAVWQRYVLSRDPHVRERLILHYAPVVKYVAGRVAVGMPASVEVGDLVSDGMLGLMDAIEKFDPSRGFRFETYAVARIRGSIIDELRAADWVPRSLRAKGRAVEAAMQDLEGELHRNPTDAELATHLGWTSTELSDALSRLSMTSMAALDDTLDVAGDRISLGDTLQDLAALSPEDSYEAQEVRRLLRVSLAGLPDRERTVLGLYYFEGMTLAQVGEVLGVSESRICQIHTKAVFGLRAKLAAVFQT